MIVLLLHGQGRTTLAMRLLGARLEKLEYHVRYFRYYTRSEKIEDIVSRFVAWVNKTHAGQPYAIVGHSMGGLIARAGLPALQQHPPIHLILLASPNRPSRLTPFVRNNLIYQYLTTDCGQLVLTTDFYQRLPLPEMSATVIAGCGGPRAKWLPYGFEPNDGALDLQDVYLGAGYDLIQVPSIHTFIMNSCQTLYHIDRILKQSRN